MQLNQVKALVTGGVSGLGLAVTRHIIANGGKAVMLDVNDDGIDDLLIGARWVDANGDEPPEAGGANPGPLD